MTDDDKRTGRERGTDTVRSRQIVQAAPNSTDREYAIGVAKQHLDAPKLREFRAWMARPGRTRGQVLGMIRRWDPAAEFPGTPKTDS